MHSIQFRSEDPLDHVCRALDTIRKMGFALEALRVEEAAAGGFRVSIVIDPQGSMSVATLLARIRSWVGVEEVTGEIANHEGVREEAFARVG